MISDGQPQKQKGKSGKVGGKFVIDCSAPCNDKIMDAAAFVRDT